MCPRRFDDLPFSTQDLVTELENPQIGPGSWSQTDDLAEHVVGSPVGQRLSHDKSCCRGGARYSSMAMDEEVHVPQPSEIASEREEEFDIPKLRRDPAWMRFDNVMKMQLQTPVHSKNGQRLRLWPAGIEDR